MITAAVVGYLLIGCLTIIIFGVVEPYSPKDSGDEFMLETVFLLCLWKRNESQPSKNGWGYVGDCLLAEWLSCYMGMMFNVIGAA
jgi:hypothetical protein